MHAKPSLDYPLPDEGTITIPSLGNSLKRGTSSAWVMVSQSTNLPLGNEKWVCLSGNWKQFVYSWKKSKKIREFLFLSGDVHFWSCVDRRNIISWILENAFTSSLSKNVLIKCIFNMKMLYQVSTQYYYTQTLKLIFNLLLQNIKNNDWNLSCILHDY